ncbi:hypothetical protein [Nitratireductor sp. OM-1]|uniref:hypothetical protein n=1 Tax=Nitratireductor sp. OM-1 TaxID=1756988 RepID=UPI0013AF1BAA|nr:hypothetical protein [Nitratireductor sp. OM-1]
MPVTILGDTLYSCPRQNLHQNPQYWSWLLKFYGFYKKGFLPGPGGILDQSNKAIEVFRILDDANDQCDRVEDEKRKKRGAKGSPPVQRPSR